MNEIALKIDRLRAQRNWSVYKLAQESGLPAPTIRKWFQTDTFPSIPALIQICQAFNITLAEFFAEGDLVEVTPTLKNLYRNWCSLTKEQQASIQLIIKTYKSK